MFLVGSEGNTGVISKVEPILQTAPGVYDDRALDGLDFLMSELGKRDMQAVLYLTNAWEWSGGYSQYLEWSGRGHLSRSGTGRMGHLHGLRAAVPRSRGHRQL